MHLLAFVRPTLTIAAKLCTHETLHTNISDLVPNLTLFTHLLSFVCPTLVIPVSSHRQCRKMKTKSGDKPSDNPRDVTSSSHQSPIRTLRTNPRPRRVRKITPQICNRTRARRDPRRYNKPRSTPATHNKGRPTHLGTAKLWQCARSFSGSNSKYSA